MPPSGLHVLIVDDDARIRAMLGQFLRERGLAVSEAHDGKSLSTVLGQTKIDAIVLASACAAGSGRKAMCP
jgi:DNA-binding response OmpR family regulator